MQLSRFIRQQRQKLNLTQRDIAEELGITDNAVGGWEREDEPAVPNPYQILGLSRLFGVTADKLLKMLPPERVAERR